MAQLLPPHNKQSRHTGDPSPPQGSPPPKSTWRIYMYVCIYLSSTHTPLNPFSHTVFSLSLSLAFAMPQPPPPTPTPTRAHCDSQQKKTHALHPHTRKAHKIQNIHTRKCCPVAEVPRDHAKATEGKTFFSNSYLNEPLLVRNWPNRALLRWLEEAGGWIDGIFINLHFGVSHGSFFSFFFQFCDT
jgi:hypothetical protein